MIRVENLVPKYFTENSRDFQLFARVYSHILSGVQYDTNTMLDILDPNVCNSRVLELLQTRLGFFTKYNHPYRELRYALSVFPYIVKAKGSIKGFELVVSVILRSIGLLNSFVIVPVLEENKILILVDSDEEFSYNENLLEDLLTYVKPVGMSVEFIRTSSIEGSTVLNIAEVWNWDGVDSTKYSKVVTPQKNFKLPDYKDDIYAESPLFDTQLEAEDFINNLPNFDENRRWTRYYTIDGDPDGLGDADGLTDPNLYKTRTEFIYTKMDKESGKFIVGLTDVTIYNNIRDREVITIHDEMADEHNKLVFTEIIGSGTN